MPEGICSTEGCGKPVRCKGLCSACYKRAGYRRANPIDSSRACVQCGNEFAPLTTRQTFCSRRCIERASTVRQAAQKRAARSEGRIWNCLQCGGDISHKRSDAKFCSDPCSNRWDLENNRDRIYAANNAWQAANPDLVRGYSRQAREADRAAYNARQAQWRERHRVRLKDYRIEFMKTWDPEGVRRRAYLHRRRARKKGNPGSVGVSRWDWMRLVNRYGGRCAYCLTRCGDLHMEHVIPVARGGRDAIGNILPACQSCNQSKSRSLLIEWRVRRRKAGAPLPGLGDWPRQGQTAA